MRVARLVLIGCAFLCVTGCSSNNKGKIEGTKWESLPGEVQGAAEVTRTIEFTKDGKVTFTTSLNGHSKAYTGTYKLARGDYVDLDFDEPLPGKDGKGEKKHRESFVINGDQMSMKDSDGTTVKFKKVS